MKTLNELQHIAWTKRQYLDSQVLQELSFASCFLETIYTWISDLSNTNATPTHSESKSQKHWIVCLSSTPEYICCHSLHTLTTKTGLNTKLSPHNHNPKEQPNSDLTKNAQSTTNTHFLTTRTIWNLSNRALYNNNTLRNHKHTLKVLKARPLQQ